MNFDDSATYPCLRPAVSMQVYLLNEDVTRSSLVNAHCRNMSQSCITSVKCKGRSACLKR
jgi:hypothetical protein